MIKMSFRKLFVFSCLVVVLTHNAYAADDLLSVNLQGLLIQMVIFIIAIFVLNKLVFQPFIQLIDRRDKLTKGTIKEAEELEEKVKQIIEEYDVKLTEARAEAQEERNLIMREAQVAADSIVGKAREESASLLHDAKIKLEADTQEIKSKIQGDIDVLAKDIAARILGREVNV